MAALEAIRESNRIDPQMDRWRRGQFYRAGASTLDLIRANIAERNRREGVSEQQAIEELVARYGFDGASFRAVVKRVRELLRKLEPPRLVRGPVAAPRIL